MGRAVLPLVLAQLGHLLRRGLGSRVLRDQPMARTSSPSDAVIHQFLSLADVLACRFQRRFPDLIDRDDAKQVARLELVRAARCLKPGLPPVPFLKPRIEGALRHHLRDHSRLVRVPRREHEKGTCPFSHSSLDLLSPCGTPWLDAIPALEPEASGEDHSQLEALLDRLPAAEAAIIRLHVLEGRSLRAIGQDLGMSTMSVQRREKAGLALLRQELA